MTLLQSLSKQLPPKIVAIKTPEWQEIGITEVHVRAGSANRRDQMESAWMSRENADSKTGFRAYVAAFFTCDSAGEWAFGENEITEAVAAFGKQDARPVQRIFDAAAKLNALTPADEAELVKN